MKITKRTIFEAVLVLIIIGQSYYIYLLIGIVHNTFFPQVSSILEDLACSDKLQIMIDLDDSGDFKEVINYGEQLINEGWSNDTIVLQGMARAYYANNQVEKSIELLNKAIAGDYLCKIAEPSEKGLHIDKAMALNTLGELYQEVGNEAEAQRLFNEAQETAKLAYGEKYSHKLFKKLCEQASFKRIKKIQPVANENNITSH